jgi:hypothetical protein
MNTINFKIESVVVPTVTWTPELAQDLNAMHIYGETQEEPHKILTVKEWIRKKKIDVYIANQIFTSQLKNIEETNKAFEQLKTKVENMSWEDKKITIDEFIKKEYGYVGKP